MLSLKLLSVSVRRKSCSGHFGFAHNAEDPGKLGLGVREADGGGFGSFLCAFRGVLVRGGGLESGGEERAADVAAAMVREEGADGLVGVLGGFGSVMPRPGSFWLVACVDEWGDVIAAFSLP